jgi:phage terminase large subunit-like protein
MQSPAQVLASLPDDERAEKLASLSPDVKAHLRWKWSFWARPEQLAPDGDWRTWLVLAGRGFGKTEAGAQWVRQRIEGGAKSIALIAETQKDLEEVMVARLLKISPPDQRPTVRYKPVRLVWPNGAQALGYNGTEPDQLRGPEFDTAWVDELAKYRYAQDTWDMLQFTMRAGLDPRVCVTTTPRPIPIIRRITADAGTVVTRGSTMDNEQNLAPSFVQAVVERYAGTRLGRQELDGEILDDVPGALWTRRSIDENRKREAPELERIVIAVDPAASSGEEADETGIVAAGVAKDKDGYNRGYVLADRSLRGSPEEWARAAVALYREMDADRIVAEKNNGGEMVESVIRAVDRNVPVTLVHASRGKAVRAEPISALYEQGRVHHIGAFPALEDQMCMFTPDIDRKQGSPDRVDALVWALSSLFDRMTARKARNEPKASPTRPTVSTGWMAG